MVGEQYLRGLTKSDSSDQVAALYRCLGAFDLDRLLGALYEFIETHVKHSPDNALEWP